MSPCGAPKQVFEAKRRRVVGVNCHSRLRGRPKQNVLGPRNGGSCLSQMKRRIEKSKRARVVKNGYLRSWMGPETRLKSGAQS